MEEVMLRAEVRDERGSRVARRLRRSGKVPATLYGRDVMARSVAVDRRDLYSALHTDAGLNAVISLDVEGDSVLTVAREIQRHPVRGEITHLDFIKVSLDVAIEADVSIELVGTPEGTKDGGFVEQLETTVRISALPTQIPSSIAIDITTMQLGDVLTVDALPDLEGVAYLDDPERPVVTVALPRVEAAPVEEELEEEELLGVPAAEAPPVEAEAPSDEE